MTGERHQRPYSEWTDEDHEAEHLNIEAYLALGQGRADIITPLVALLRSSQPIDAAVRDAMADALEGKDRYGIPIRLEVSGQNKGQLGGWAGKRQRFHRDLAIGNFVEERRRKGFTRDEALRAAAEQFPLIGEDNCRRAIGVYQKYRAWLAEEGPRYAEVFSFAPEHLREGLLKDLYFQNFLWRSG